MSTGNIGRAIKPRTKVTPEYGKKDEKAVETVADKLDKVADLLSSEIKGLIGIIKLQQEQIDTLIEKVEGLDSDHEALNKKIQRIESKVETSQKMICEKLTEIKGALDDAKKESDESKKKKWF